MGLRLNVLIVASTLVALSCGIPTSLVEEIKSSELRNNKVKRSHPNELVDIESNEADGSLYKPSAIKRGVSLESKLPSDLQWDQDRTDLLINKNYLPNVTSLFRYPDGSPDETEKKIREFEKGYQYARNNDDLDEVLENAVLKSGVYGDSGGLNQYRFQSRLKRDVELSPEEVLTLLSLYENSRQHQIPQSDNYRYPWTRFEPTVDTDHLQEQDDDNWLNTPVVYSHASSFDKDSDPKYLYESRPEDVEVKDRWRGFGVDGRSKRFMISKRKSLDPTRELRYINGPNKNDFHTLSQLLSNQRGSDNPIYRRLIL
ncbi:uncharacterized protein LOC130898569 [Diorhabda carinulata]|uniref:uncharacterized protein LOC130898569 n=1 Tax=Diorhabda carinulata TaxID=1163345 RepID=UPI0025A02B7F|nr:uncharacterized protein LOC130898569 [Diorhabda carinulata]XP_057663941.1 uncharacterized protein LOC130898569 [Diorhabda carinulata]XP_057663942.1 uncharacterized protein LOC130898569 [Diorhabda carinulata]XP_057663943.1 uncharacterized protein LOC130898569 [Diorhabda carinulata]XP_057663944.1 uncharacterized protein LOC130898569 [Diorhabda carinulata]